MTARVLKRSLGVATVATLLTSPAPRAQAPPVQAGSTPKLVVILVMDQFRADYVDLYGSRWTQGLRRLIDKGAYFTRAAYPYAGTVTCAGHATIGTGTFPATHGMTGNAWFDRLTKRMMPCVADVNVSDLAFGGGTAKERYSADSLKVPTFSDELQKQLPNRPRVVSVALKPRSAITLGGRGDDDTVVVWEEDDGTWATSDAYTKTPWSDVDAFVRKHPISKDYGQTWLYMRPANTYLFTDDGIGEAQPAGWTRAFPHMLDSPSGLADATFVSRWERSPWSDEYVLDLALSLLDSRQLGQRDTTDFLSLSLPGLDLVGHAYGPRSHEVQDVLARADRTVGRLIDALDAKVGAGRYTLAFSSDHGVATIPEQLLANRESAGRVATGAIRTAVENTVAKFLGPGGYFGGLENQQISLMPGTIDKLNATAGAVDALRNALRDVSGVWRVLSADELADTAPTSDEIVRAWRLSYVPGRSGDFAFVPHRNWIVGASGTTHGTPYDYDQRVPLVLYGAGIKPGRYTSAASPADIAHSLGALTGVKMPNPGGRPLTEAIQR
jgi:predicted AlkP superfamily pyrophosphatase or phosphodiesterase